MYVGKIIILRKGSHGIRITQFALRKSVIWSENTQSGPCVIETATQSNPGDRHLSSVRLLVVGT